MDDQFNPKNPNFLPTTYKWTQVETIRHWKPKLFFGRPPENKATSSFSFSLRFYSTDTQEGNSWPVIATRSLSHRYHLSTPEIISSPATEMETRPAISATEPEIVRLMESLTSTSIDTQREAASQLRLLAKASMDNCIVIGNSGAITPLVNLLHSTDLTVQEYAVTALLNLSINYNNKSIITDAGALEPLIHVLEAGSSEAKENSAATLYSLSMIKDNKIKLGRCGAIAPLVELLKNGTSLGKKDALAALVNLSNHSKNKALIVKAGTVKPLVELMDPGVGMADKAVVALLANLATIQEGRAAIGEAGGVPVLVETVELGSEKGKEFAAAALCHLCCSSSRFCNMMLKEDAIPPLMGLLHSGTPRAKEKVHKILRHLKIYQHNDP